MFGGVGIYAGERFFALMDDDVLYFKVDGFQPGELRGDVGMGPFRPGGVGGEVMQYYEVPADVLEDVDQLATWVAAAVAVAGEGAEEASALARSPLMRSL